MTRALVDFVINYFLDPTLLDLVLSLPDLTWAELGKAAALLLGWDLISRPVSAMLWRRARRGLARGLLHAAVALRP